MDDLTASKIEALFVMFILALLCSFTPLKIRSYLINKSKLPQMYTEIVLSSCLCFGGGVLLATVFLHIYPESEAQINDLMSQGVLKDTGYPLPELILCSGFFFIYLLEEIVHVWVHHHHHHLDAPTGHSQKYPKPIRKTQIERSSRSRCESGCSAAIIVGCHPLDELSESIGEISVLENGHKKDSGDNTLTNQTQDTFNNIFKPISILRSVLIVLALSLHGIFEGLALGLEGSTYGVWLFCLAICSHKVFIAFSIGMELLETGITIGLYSLHMTVFSIASPLGATIGTILYNVESNSQGTVTIAILQGISGGTILFVVFCEILERERTKMNGRFIRFFALLVGFSIMAALQAIKEPDSGSGGGFNSTLTYLPKENI